MDADLGAYILLSKEKLKNSVDILVENFENRHGLKFKKSLLKRVQERIF